jgi:hypothetical protein
MDFHWAKKPLYVWLRSAMSFNSGRFPVSISFKMVPMFWSFSCPDLRSAGSQLAAVTVPTCPRLDFVALRTLFLALLLRMNMGTVVHSALTVLGSEVLLLPGLKPVGGFVPQCSYNS